MKKIWADSFTPNVLIVPIQTTHAFHAKIRYDLGKSFFDGRKFRHLSLGADLLLAVLVSQKEKLFDFCFEKCTFSKKRQGQNLQQNLDPSVSLSLLLLHLFNGNFICAGHRNRIYRRGKFKLLSFWCSFFVTNENRSGVFHQVFSTQKLVGSKSIVFSF